MGGVSNTSHDGKPKHFTDTNRSDRHDIRRRDAAIYGRRGAKRERSNTGLAAGAARGGIRGKKVRRSLALSIVVYVQSGIFRRRGQKPVRRTSLITTRRRVQRARWHTK